jgi:predicted dehydrogenase|nr:Gfo/Idh/MocA family oxidoreductase [Candidatus Krumholzibacteria bacterium]
MKNSQNTPLRAAVIGTGYLGRFHAQKYATLPDVELAFVVDSDGARAQAMGQELGVPFVQDFMEIRDQIQVASVVTPTSGHHDIALPLLEAGVHLLVEKPITTTEDQARALIKAASDQKVVLQVGHLERFNPAVQVLHREVKQPLFVEAHRLSKFNGRATDVDVVLDLMIHDLDILLSLVDGPVTEVRATGVPIMTPNVDMANARLTFAGGCTANLTASRMSFKDMRKFRVFHPGGYVAADCALKENLVFRKPESPGVLPVPEKLEHGPVDNLMEEIKAFLAAVRGEAPVPVTGEDGLRALELAGLINAAIAEQLP